MPDKPNSGPASGRGMTEPASGGSPSISSEKRPRILWLHTQPEPYFNLMLDDLTTGGGYRVAGMDAAGGPEGGAEYLAAFAYRGPGLYRERATPAVAETVFLKALPGKESRPPGFREKYHADWRADLLPLNFDAVIVSGYAGRTQQGLLRYCHRAGIPVALWSDSNVRSQRGKSLRLRIRRSLKKRYLRGTIKESDLLLTANQRGVAYWRYYGAPKEKIRVCPCYADYGRIDAMRGKPAEELLARCGVGAGEPFLFSAARLVPDKALDLAIPAFLRSGLPERGWKYLIAGVGPEEAALKALAGGSLGKSVRFLGFAQPSDNLALMAHARMLVLPSRYEPHGIVVCEALAAGTPVLASNVVGAIPGLVRDGESGLIFRSGDGAALEKKMAALADDALIDRLRAGARPAFEEWYARTSPLLVVPRAMAELISRRRTGGR